MVSRLIAYQLRNHKTSEKEDLATGRIDFSSLSLFCNIFPISLYVVFTQSHFCTYLSLCKYLNLFIDSSSKTSIAKF